EWVSNTIMRSLPRKLADNQQVNERKGKAMSRLLSYRLLLLFCLPLIYACEGQTSLTEAARVGDIARIKSLLAQGSNVNEPNALSETPLMVAARFSTVEALNVLLDAGADIQKRDHLGKTALAYAATGGSAENVKLLLNRGANVNERDNNGEIPLIFAASEGKV